MTTRRRLLATIFAAGMLLAAFLDWGVAAHIFFGVAALVVVLVPPVRRTGR